MYLTDARSIFSWQEPSKLLPKLHAQYESLLDCKFNAMIDRLEDAGNLQIREHFASVIAGLSTDEYSALLCEPEVSFRLLWPSHHTDAQAGVFLANTLFSKGADLREQRIIHGGLPLDATSRIARTVDISGFAPRRPDPGHVYDASTLEKVLAKADHGNKLVQSTAPNAWTVIRDFTKLLHYLPDTDAPEQFSSGSSGQFVGRTVIANAHLGKITEFEISEALVHEAIHSALYMVEQQRPWVLKPELYAGPMRIASPWTGNPLPLRPYLQACFVWYGLVCYWVHVIRSGIAEKARPLSRLEIALSGFRRNDLLDNVSEFQSSISDEAKTAISEIQQQVRDCLDLEAVV